MELIEALPRLIGWAVPIIILIIIILPQADPHSARIRARRHFSSREITRCKRAGIDFSHPDRRSHGANGFARRHDQRREAGSDDA